MNTKRSLLFSLLIFISWLPANGTEPTTIPDEIKTEIRKRVDNLYSTAFVAGVMDANGVSYFSYGTRDLDRGGAVNEDTLFQIGGVTKTFTTTLLADMADRGEVGLSDLIEDYLPEGYSAPVYGPNQIGINLLHLATHRSGLPSFPNNASGPPLNILTGYTLENMYQFLSWFSLARAPGSTYEFSNFGIGLLGQLLAGSKKTDFETLLHERVLDVLGLTDTVYRMSSEQELRFATPYCGVVCNPPWDPGVLEPTGGLCSTARDLMKYLAANMGLVATPLNRAMTNAHNPVASTADGTRIGLAWINRSKGGVSAVEITGNCNGATAAYAGFIPAQQRAVVVLATGLSTAEDVGRNLLSPSLGIVSKTAYPVAAVVPTRILRKYVGTYEGPAWGKNRSWQITYEHGRLVYTYADDGGFSYSLYPVRTNTFRSSPVINGTAAFRFDSQGQVSSMSWSQVVGTDLISASFPKTGEGSMPPELCLTGGATGLEMELLGDAGGVYVVEASSDLRNWTPVSTNVTGTASIPVSSAEAMRFYRARE